MIKADDRNFLYDYNEVQELYGNASDYDVYIAGATNLGKAEMLRLMRDNLLRGGAGERNVLYLDFTTPFVLSGGIQEAVVYFAQRAVREKPIYVIINEVALYVKWAGEVNAVKAKQPLVRFLCSSSISPTIHEYFFNNPDPKSKIIVLSKKNDSNIKHEQDCFGVFEEFKYNIKHGICEIKGLTASGKLRSHHVVPKEIDGYPVEIIASGAFHHRTEMREIVLPEGIVYIGDYAFTHCKNLQCIKLPDSLKYVGDCAFLGSAVVGIEGGANITHVGSSAFYGTPWLRDNNCEFIVVGKTLYKYNSTAYDVRLPSGIESIGAYAFSNSKIKEVDLTGVSRIGEGAFYCCAQLERVMGYTPDMVSGLLFYFCKLLKVFPYPLKSVGKFAFHSVPLESIDLSKITSIGVLAFYNNKLKTIALDSVGTINDYAFADSQVLKEAQINPTADIGRTIFYNCVAVKTAAFGGQHRLNSYFDGESPIEKLTIKGDCVDNLCRGSTSLKDIDIQGDSIGNWAFYACKALRSIKLATKIIGAWCFANCDGIEEITLSANCEYISMNAFRYCHNLKWITIPCENPLDFGANAFYSTSNIKQFFIRNKDEYLKMPIWKEYANSIKELMT